MINMRCFLSTRVVSLNGSCHHGRTVAFTYKNEDHSI